MTSMYKKNLLLFLKRKDIIFLNLMLKEIWEVM